MDEAFVENVNRRFVRLAPYNDDNNNQASPTGRLIEPCPDPIIQERFLQHPTAKAAFEIAGDVEYCVYRYIENMKSECVSYSDIEGFNALARLQDRVRERLGKMERFAKRLDHDDDISAIVVVDTILEMYIR